MGTQTAQEQLMLELVNRARLDPQAEANRFGIGLNDGLSAGSIDAAAKQPLAMNDSLIAAARDHDQWMLDTDTFSHTGAGGSSPQQRMSDAGYVFIAPWSAGENISWRGVTPGVIDLTQAIIAQHEGLFKSPGHRMNILAADFREIGVGQRHGAFTQNGVSYDSSMVTQDFAFSGSDHFLTGVAYDDTDGDGFYSVGEGVSGMVVDVASQSAASAAAGGYDMQLANGAHTATFSSGSLSAPMTVSFNIVNANVKMDIIDGGILASSATTTIISGVPSLLLLGVADLDAFGSWKPEAIRGNKGANHIKGYGGADTLHGDAGNDILEGGRGDDTLHGGFGADSLYGQENDDRLYGEDGDDVISGGGGRDILFGQAGHDTLKGDAGNDILHGGGGRDALLGGDNDDRLYGNAGDDKLYGGAGRDFLSGGDNADELYGQGGEDTLHGGGGNDILNGGGQADTLHGEAGDDILWGHNGDDILYGGARKDILHGGNDQDILWGGDGADTLNGDAQADQLHGGNDNDVLLGGNGADTLYGEAQDDILYGQLDNDILRGGGGDDRLYGGGQNDQLFGGLNNDFLDGGPGNDYLVGEGQADTFFYKQGYGADVIADFQNNVDVIDLSSFGFASVNDALSVASQVSTDVLFSFSAGDVLRVKDAIIAELANDIVI